MLQTESRQIYQVLERLARAAIAKEACWYEDMNCSDEEWANRCGEYDAALEAVRKVMP